MKILAFFRRLLRRRLRLSGDEWLQDNVRTTIEKYRQGGIKIGENCYLHGLNMGVSEPIEIGNNCVLTYCTILGHDASPALFIPELQKGGLMDRISKKKLTRIHDNSFIGINAILLCGVSVGPNSIVGAGSVVTKDVPANSVVAGNPATVLCSIHEFIDKHRQEMETHPEYYPGLGSY